VKRIGISIIRLFVHIFLFPLELFLRSRAPKISRPIFIIGAPRSGTSLLYELMVTRFHFAYISNLSHRFYLTPLAAAWVGGKTIEKWYGNFTSRYGHIKGWGAPNEGGWVWRRWLDDGNWTDGANFPAALVGKLRKLTDGMSMVFNAPFLNKNVMHSNRLLLMRKIWPNALFIEVKRKRVDNARSIIRAERNNGGPVQDADHWWSVRPAIAAQYAGKSDIERAAAQVVGVEQDIMRDMAVVGEDRLIVVNYNMLCADVDSTLELVRNFLGRNGITLTVRSEIPARFSLPPQKPMADEEEILLQEALGKLVS